MRSVKDYVTTFTNLLFEVPSMANEDKLMYFMSVTEFGQAGVTKKTRSILIRCNFYCPREKALNAMNHEKEDEANREVGIWAIHCFNNLQVKDSQP
ncbi:unnamed protein product [Prunus brigantina]